MIYASLSVMEESQALNSKIFSLVRMKLLESLVALGADGATYRELRAALDVKDGVLYSNLNVLQEMGYIKLAEIEFEGKKLDSYTITPEGRAEWEQVKKWLCKFLACGGEGNGKAGETNCMF